MKNKKHEEIAGQAIMSITFFWLGLFAAPGAGPHSAIVRTGVIATLAALAAYALMAFFWRDLSKGSWRSRRR